MEGMVPPSSISSKYAIWTNYGNDRLGIRARGGGERYYFLIVDTNGLLESLNEIWDSWNASTESQEEYDEMDVYDKAELYRDVVHEHVLAMLRVKESKSSDNGDCNLAWEVERSASDKGLGPTLYDMVMSISPNGLVSDRNSVSDAALKYWEISANHRFDIDKKFLDTPYNKYTVDPTDNCTLHDDPYGARGTDSEGLIKYASRQLAIEFFELFHDEIHKYVTDNASMDTIVRLGNLGGDEYVKTIISEYESSSGDEPIDEDVIDDWTTYKMQNEHDMFDNFVEDDLESRSSILNLSYNTDYASGDYQKMVNKFDNFEVEARELLGEVYTLLFLDGLDITPGQYFDDLYYT